jgi:multidrug efflux pump
MRIKALLVVIYIGLLWVTWHAFLLVPGGFIPSPDKQYLIGFAQLPDGASLDRTDKIVRQMTDIARKTPGVSNVVGFPGLSINGFVNASNAALVFLNLDEFEDRRTPELSATAIAGKLNQDFGAIQGAFIAIFTPPPVDGLGSIGGFKLQLEDQAGLGDEVLYNSLQAVLMRAWQTPQLVGMFSSYQINVPQLNANIDREKAKQMGINLNDLFATLQVYLGSLYVNDFNRFGKTYRVVVQADAAQRASLEDIARLKTRNERGEMVPLGALLDVQHAFGPDRAIRYNAFPSADINGAPAPGVSS